MKKNPQDNYFIDYIGQNAKRYFPELVTGQISVQLRDKQERTSAVLYRFDLKDNTQDRSIIVKVPLRNRSKMKNDGSVYEKPYLFQKAETGDMHWLYYTALTAIDDYFTGLCNHKLGAIRVLDYLPEHKAVFTEESKDPSLQKLFLRRSRFHVLNNSGDLTAAFQNAGTWLRMYQVMPKEEKVQVRHQHREDYIEAVIKLTDFMSKVGRDESFFKQTASIVIQKGREFLPETLPLGLGHGDYAMRNILIGPNARVTVLDTFSKWRVPIYEDLGYFLNALKTSYPQVVSQGLLFSSRQIAEYEAAFLKGYFGSENIPYSTIKLYEILAMLDKWSSLLNRYHRRSAKLKNFGGLKIALTSRYFKTYTKSLLKQIDGVAKGSKFSAIERSY